MHFLGRKYNFSSLNFFFLKIGRLTFMNIWKHFMKDKNLFLKKPCTLGAWNRQFSSKWEGDFMQLCVLGDPWSNFKGWRSNVEPQISMYYRDIKPFFNLDNLEPAPGRPAYRFLVRSPLILELDVLEQAPGCPNWKMVLYPCNTYWFEVPHKKIGLYP